MAEEEVLKYETRENGRIVIMTLNRPEQRNALSTELRQALNESWERFADDDEAWVAIVTGAGPAFCAGNDLRERRQVADGERAEPRRQQRPSRVNFPLNESLNLWKPTIAAVNGYAVAGGFNLAMQCDIRIAAEEAEFGIAETRWNRTATWLPHLTKHMQLSHALEIALWGDKRISAQRAYEMGFVSRVVPAAGLMDEAMAWAERMLWLAPRAVRNFKQVIYRSGNMSTDEARAFSTALQANQQGMQDSGEGLKAFAEKRRPEFKNR